MASWWPHGYSNKRANQRKLESARCKQKRLARAGRKPFDLDIEEVLYEWVHE